MNRRTYVNIYLVLLVSVGISTLLSVFGHTKLAILGIFSVALVKAGLVLGYYMHLKEEKAWVKLMLASAVVCMVILFVGLVPDIVYQFGRMGT